MSGVVLSLLSSWAEIHALEMGVVFGILGALLWYSGREAAAAAGLAALVGFASGASTNAPWEGFWHPWYVLLPALLITFLGAIVLYGRFGPTRRHASSTTAGGGQPGRALWPGRIGFRDNPRLGPNPPGTTGIPGTRSSDPQ